MFKTFQGLVLNSCFCCESSGISPEPSLMLFLCNQTHPQLIASGNHLICFLSLWFYLDSAINCNYSISQRFLSRDYNACEFSPMLMFWPFVRLLKHVWPDSVEQPGGSCRKHLCTDFCVDINVSWRSISESDCGPMRCLCLIL